jgi:hypothetical protein
MVNAASGVDVIGNQVPDIIRSLYDERHNTRTRYGFGEGQVLAERSLVVESLRNTLKNPKSVVYRNGINTIMFIEGLDISKSEEWFTTPESTRILLDYVWRVAYPQQINELFFEVMNDALANNYEFSDIFKTSRLSLHSIITVEPEYRINDVDVYY